MLNLSTTTKHRFHMSYNTTGPKITSLFILFAALFATLLITSIIVAVKIVNVWGHVVPAAVFLFPATYIIGDILTEVYGLRFARRVIWLGFLCNVVALIGFWIGGILPAASFWQGQDSYDSILGNTPRIVMASFAGYLAGELLNSMVLARLKVWTRGRMLWMRTVSSTVVGQGLDTILFICIAFIGTMSNSNLIDLVITQWIFKVIYETLATPLTYILVNKVKAHEAMDVYEDEFSVNPFSV